MKKMALCAAVVFLSSTLLFGGEQKRGLQISFDSDDSATEMGTWHDVHLAQIAITTRDRSATLMLINGIVAVQLTESVIGNIKPEENATLAGEILASAVRIAMHNSVEYPVAKLRSAEVRDGAIILRNQEGKPVFTNVKVNGTDMMRDFTSADAARFVNAIRALKR